MTSTPLPRRRARGLTLIECCVVAAVIAVLAASAGPGLQSLIDGRRLDGAAALLGADLQLVRTEAVARNLPLRLTVYSNATGSCAVIHTGNVADCRCDDTGAGRCTGSAVPVKSSVFPAADRVALASNARSLLFDPVHGTTTPTATLRLIGAQGREIRHVVNVMGRVRSCSAGARVAGYTAC